MGAIASIEPIRCWRSNSIGVGIRELSNWRNRGGLGNGNESKLVRFRMFLWMELSVNVYSLESARRQEQGQ